MDATRSSQTTATDGALESYEGLCNRVSADVSREAAFENFRI